MLYFSNQNANANAEAGESRVSDQVSGDLPKHSEPCKFGAINEKNTIIIARAVRLPYMGDPEYNAFRTPLQNHTLSHLSQELLVVQSKFSHSEEFVRGFFDRCPRDEIHGAQTLPACMAAAEILEPGIGLNGKLVSHQISRPFTCELDLYVHSQPLPRTSFPSAQRLLFAHFEIDGRSVFVKGYPTKEPVLRIAQIHEHLRLHVKSTEVEVNDETVTIARMAMEPLSENIKHEVITDPRMQGYVLMRLAVHATAQMCECGYLPETALSGYVARSEGLKINSLLPLFSREHQVVITIPHAEQVRSENSVVAPVDLSVRGFEGESASVRTLFAWDKPGRSYLWTTHHRK